MPACELVIETGKLGHTPKAAASYKDRLIMDTAAEHIHWDRW